MNTMIRRTERFTFFFRPEAPFSQWHPARFELAGHAQPLSHVGAVAHPPVLDRERDLVRTWVHLAPVANKALAKAIAAKILDVTGR